MNGTLLPAHKAAADFHDHLDGCEQCREQPFNLCPTGDRLIRALGLIRYGFRPNTLIRACVVKPVSMPHHNHERF